MLLSSPGYRSYPLETTFEASVPRAPPLLQRQTLPHYGYSFRCDLDTFCSIELALDPVVERPNARPSTSAVPSSVLILRMVDLSLDPGPKVGGAFHPGQVC